MNKNSRGFVPILIVVILGIIALFGYLILESPTGRSLLQPSPTPTEMQMANWKTYTDSQYNYSIKYPDNVPPEKSSNDIYLSFVSFGNLSDK